MSDTTVYTILVMSKLPKPLRLLCFYWISLMLMLKPVTRRIVYVTIFELLAIVFATLLLSAMNDGSAQNSLPVAIASSTAAVIWNFIYNTLFERWERRNNVRHRSVLLRAIHAIGFEGGLVLILIPLFMWWYSVGPLTALMMEAALLVFFLVFTFVFTWIFDRIVPRVYTDKA